MRFTQLKRSSHKRLILVLCYLSLLILIALAIAISRSHYGIELYKSQADPSSVLEEDLDQIETAESNLEVTEQSDECITIHLAIVCGGFNSTRNFYVLLKSVLFYRTDIIHLHLFTDNISQKILKTLFESWDVPDLLVDFYNITNYERDVSWITSQHYSHRYGLIKLVVPNVIYEKHHVPKIILMDTDMLVLGDIRKLWNEFDNFDKNNNEEKPFFGLVENQSDWYLSNGPSSSSRGVWPAIGRGFNSGLILIDLDELRRQDWPKVWRQTAELELTSYLSTSLADQDIFNAVLRINPGWVYTLPCSYNVQLNDHTNLDEVCPQSRKSFKLIHWNSPYKFFTKNPKAVHFENWYLTFMNWDAKLLTRRNCDNGTESKQVHVDDSSSLEMVCREIQPRPHEKLRIFLYFLEFELEPADCDVTLVAHLSLDRLQVLDQLASHWPGPISVAIYLSELETNLLLASIQNSNHLYPNRKNIGYHLVFRANDNFNYPINRLRNVALNNAITPFVFLSDVDFLPSTNLYSYLKYTIASMTKTKGSDSLAKLALVVPAFESLQYRFDFPSSKAELLNQLNLGSVSIFRDQIWPRGQAPTNYAKWKASTKVYKVDWKPEYEPFIVTNQNVSRFDERFVGFGWNKVENLMKLAASGYEFLVLPEAFVIHKFHSASYDIMKHRESIRYRTCVQRLKRLFLIEMKMQYPEFFQRIGATSASQTVEDGSTNEPDVE